MVCELLPGRPEVSLESLGLLVDAGYVAHAWSTDTDGWVPVEPRRAASWLDGELRDWLFLPEPAGDRLRHLVAEWRDAILACTADTNLLVDSGTPPPTGWARPYSR